MRPRTTSLLIAALLSVVGALFWVATYRWASRFVVKAVAHEWWWDFQYPGLRIAHSSELHIPAGVPVRFELSSADVLHSLWFPALKDPVRLLPDIERILDIGPQPSGRSFGSCDAECGCKGVCMRFRVSVDSATDFKKWTSAARRDQSTVTPHPTEPPPCVTGGHIPVLKARRKGIAQLLGDG